MSNKKSSKSIKVDESTFQRFCKSQWRIRRHFWPNRKANADPVSQSKLSPPLLKRLCFVWSQRSSAWESHYGIRETARRKWPLQPYAPKTSPGTDLTNIVIIVYRNTSAVVSSIECKDQIDGLFFLALFLHRFHSRHFGRDFILDLPNKNVGERHVIMNNRR